MNKLIFKRLVLRVLIISQLLYLFACSSPYNKEDILCEYDELNCLYYVKDNNKKYKYSDYIYDDVSNEMYKKSTPNLADYKTGSGMLDYDIGAYVDARMSYALKIELIKKYSIKLDLICADVHDSYFEQRNSYVYFYDKNTKKSKLLCDEPVTNISYDDEVPSISFDINSKTQTEEVNELDGRKIMLSDIIASNMTIEGYMKVILGVGKDRVKFFLDKMVNDEEINNIATSSNAS